MHQPNPVGPHDLPGVDTLASELSRLQDAFNAGTTVAESPFDQLRITDILITGSIGAEQGRAGESDLDLLLGVTVSDAPSPRDEQFTAFEQVADDFGVFVHHEGYQLRITKTNLFTTLDAAGVPECDVRSTYEARCRHGGYDQCYDVLSGNWYGV
jgi:hypothetical protein